MKKSYIGTSGYAYKHWRGSFYPKTLKETGWFDFYTKNFSTVELNVTFYRLPPEKAFLTWAKKAPADFVFSVKGSQYITQYKKLNDVDESLELFFSRVSLLGCKIGVILWQFPPNFKEDKEKIKSFCQKLKKQKVQNCFEFRDKSWFNSNTYRTLDKNNIPIVLADYPFNIIERKKPLKSYRESILIPEIGNFNYIRRHGPGGLYSSNYPKTYLTEIADYINSNNKPTYLYFNNDAQGYAPINAAEVKKMLKAR